MRKPRLPLAWAVLSLVIAAPATIFGSRSAVADPSCVVIALSGNVAFEHNGAKSNLARGDALATGDVVATALGGRVKLRFADGSEVNLAENSELRIEAIDVNVNAGTRSILLDLPMGILRAAAAKLLHPSGSRFEIHTGIAYSAVRGTHWIVVAQPNEARVYVQEGHVAVGPDFASNEFSKLVDAGRWVRVTRQTGVGPLETAPPAAINQLINATQASASSGTTNFAEAAPPEDSSAGSSVSGNPVGNTVSAVAGTVGSVTGTVGATVGAVGGTANAVVGNSLASTSAVVATTATTVSALTGTVAGTVSSLTGTSTPSNGTSSNGSSSSSGGSSSGGSSSGGSSSGGSSSGGSSSSGSSSGGSSSSSGSSAGGSSSDGSSSSGSSSSGGLGGAVKSAVGGVKSALGGLLH